MKKLAIIGFFGLFTTLFVGTVVEMGSNLDEKKTHEPAPCNCPCDCEALEQERNRWIKRWHACNWELKKIGIQ